jgi:hypothetical protein
MNADAVAIWIVGNGGIATPELPNTSQEAARLFATGLKSQDCGPIG